MIGFRKPSASSIKDWYDEELDKGNRIKAIKIFRAEEKLKLIKDGKIKPYENKLSLIQRLKHLFYNVKT